MQVDGVDAVDALHRLHLTPPSAIYKLPSPPSPSRSHRQLAPSEAPPPHRPVLWVHRHIHKTGGTSLRAIFKQLHERKALTLVPGWNCRIDRIRNLSASSYSASTDAVSHGWCAEMHQDCKWFSAQLLPLIHSLRRTMRVLLSAFVREPFAHSLSLWMWVGKPKFGKYNRSIDFWLPFNFQSNTLLFGDHFDQYFMGNKPPKGALYRKFSERDFQTLVSVMRARYDVVCPTGRMELCITYMLRVLGLPTVATPRIAPRPNWQTGIARDHALLEREECARAGVDCRRLVDERTKYDARLFAFASRWMERVIRASGFCEDGAASVGRKALACEPR